MDPKLMRGAKQTALLLLALALAVCAGLTAGSKNGPAAWWLFLPSAFGAIFLVVVAVLQSPPEGRSARTTEFGCLAVAFFGVAVILLPIFQSARSVSGRTVCRSSLKQLALAAIMYSMDNDERLPPSAGWRTGVERYLSADVGEMRCPTGATAWSYALNAALAGLSLSDVEDPGETVLLFEADAWEKEAVGGREWFALRHNGRGNAAFANGIARSLNRYGANESRWEAKRGVRLPGP